MAETNIKVLKIEVDTGTGQIKVNGLKTSVDGLDKSVEKFTKSLRDNKTANEEFASAAGIAGATVNEFGRFISDLPFGVTAVTNNVSQLGSMFAILVQKAQKLNTGLSTTKNVLKLLKDQLIGPVGILLLFQAAVALVETFAGSAKKAAQETDKMVEALSKVEAPILEMEALAEIMESNTSSTEEQTYALKELKKLGFDPLNESLEVFKNRYIEIMTLTAIKGVFAERIAEVVKERLVLQDEIKKLKEGLTDEDTFLESIAEYLNIPLQEASDAIASMKLNLSGVAFTAVEAKLKEEADRFKQTIKDLVKAMGSSAGADADDKLAKMLESWAKKREISELRAQEDILNVQRRYSIKQLQLLGATQEQLVDVNAYYDSEIFKLRRENQEELIIIAEGAYEKELETLEQYLARKKKAEENAARAVENLRQENLQKQADIAMAVGAIVSGVADNIDAAYQKEIDIEQNKTNALNNELRERLANEQLSANERRNIQDQIAKNDEALRVKQEAIEKKRFKANKVAAIAEATISTFVAATGVLKETKGGSVARIAGMIAVIGAGLAQVAMIAKQQFVSSQSKIGVGAGSVSSSGGDVQAPDFNIVGQSPSNQLAAAVQGQLSQPIKTYVVSKDVSTAQEMERNIIGSASLG
jgi:hypothetical protein